MNKEPEIIDAVPIGENALMLPERTSLEYIDPVMDLDTAKRRLAVFQEFVRFYLKEGEDFGTIPGTNKPTLFKSGADKLCEIYGLEDKYPEDRRKRTERWDLDPPLFDYETTCVLYRKGTNISVCEGVGSCNSYESRYRWRDAQRLCPQCHQPAIIKSKPEFGSGWFCFPKKGGCGAKFPLEDPKITNQTIGRIPNPDLADVKNTILKMSKKRAKIDATIAATRSAGIFTQDVEEMQPAQPAEEEPRNDTVTYGQRAEELKELDKQTDTPQGRISSPQAVAFDNTSREHGRSPEQVKQFLDQLGGYKQSTEIKKEHWDQARTWALNQTSLMGELTGSVQQAQFRKLYGVAGKKRVSNDDLHKYIKEVFNCHSVKDLNKDQFEETIKWLDSLSS